MSDLIDRPAAIMIASGYCHPANIAKEIEALPSVETFEFGKWYDFQKGYVLEVTTEAFRISKEVTE